MKITDFPLKLAKWSSRFPKWTMLSGILLTLVSLCLTLGLSLKNDFMDLLPGQLPEVKMLRTLLNKMGGVGFEAVIVTSPSKFKNRQFLKDLRKRLRGMKRKTKKQGLVSFQIEYENQGTLLRKILQVDGRTSSAVLKELREDIDKWREHRMIAFAVFETYRSFFENRKLLFLTTSELKTIFGKLKKKLRYEFNKKQPGYVDLLDEPDPGFDLKELKAKYRREFKDTPRFLEVKDGSLTHSALIVRPSGASSDFEFTARFIKSLKREIQELKASEYHPKMDVKHLGPYSKNLAEYKDASSELTRSFSLTFVLLVILLVFFFRRIRVVILVFVPLLFATLWTFGLTYLTIGYLNIITGFTGALLLGLGVDYGIYLIDRFYLERRQGRTVEDAILVCFRTTGKAVATAGLTTASGFFALLLCGFKGFSQFGYISGLGVLSCLVSMSTILPALIILLDRKWPGEPASALFPVNAAASKRFPFSRTLLGTAFLVLMLVPVAVISVNFEYDIRKLSYQKTRFKIQEERWAKLKKIFKQGMKPIVYLVQSKEELRRLMSGLKEFKKKAEAGKIRGVSKKAIDSLTTIYRFMPINQKEKLRWLKRMKDLMAKYKINDYLDDFPEKKKKFKAFQNDLNAGFLHMERLPYPLQRDLIVFSKDDFQAVDGYLLILSSGMNMYDGRDAQKLMKALKNVKLDGKPSVFTGEPITFALVFKILRVEGFFSVLISLLVVALVVMVDLKSWRFTLLSLWPLCTGLLGMTLILAWFDIRLTFYNLIVLPALLGICIDAGVHIIHRYRENPEMGVGGVQRELAPSIAIASLTTVISFATTIMAGHAGMKSIGTLAVVGLFSGLIAALFFLPALMEVMLGQSHDGKKLK